MRILGSMLVLSLLLALGVTHPPAASAKTKVIATVVNEGTQYCPQRSYLMGGVKVRSGRCYTPMVFRDRRGTYLGFVNSPAGIPAGQVVRLDTPAGRRARAQTVLLVPMQYGGQNVPIPVNTVQLVRLRQEIDEEVDEDDDDNNNSQIDWNNVHQGRVIVLLPAMHMRNPVATYVVRY